MFPCPWIRVHGQQLKRKWKEIEKEGGPYIIANHNSKMDSLLILALLPFSFGPTLRTLVKDALFSLPLFGGMCTSVGHFPVYFKGTKEGMQLVPYECHTITLLYQILLLTKYRSLCFMSCTGDFRVNREAQAKVATAMDEYVKSGGGLLM